MNKGLIFGLGLLLGAGAGVGVSAVFLKQKYQQQADEEIASVRNSFLAEADKRKKEREELEEMQKKAEAAMKQYATETKEEPKGKVVVNRDTGSVTYVRPYVISPMVFADPVNSKGYGNSTLKYYTDGAVVDEDEHPLTMEELDDLVGREALTHFGEFGEYDSVCVRNERMKTDFQILQMAGSWAEAIRKHPSPR